MEINPAVLSSTGMANSMKSGLMDPCLAVQPCTAWYDCLRCELAEPNLLQALSSEELSKPVNKTAKK